ncbi:MAG: MerR family transcriptional regulator [Deinococcales bacterium]
MSGSEKRLTDVRTDALDSGAHYSVGEVARAARVSVRTLHHYDAIGLLCPTERGDNGYRHYTREDLERLQRILAYRELGFELAAIRQILDDPGTDRLEHLRRQAALLDARMERLDAMRRALRKTMEAYQMGIDLDPEEMLEVFGDFDPTEHAAEAEERWGDTDAYRQSQRRVKQYGKADWQRIQRESEAVEQQFTVLMHAGVPATDPRAMDAAEAHRQHIGRWFYDCDRAMHASLADMIEADPRFGKHYEDRQAGLATYVANAIRANAART